MIDSEVYALLKERTATAEPIRKELENLDAEIRSGRYNSKALDEMTVKKSELRSKLNSVVTFAGIDAKKLVDAYRSEAGQPVRLDPAQINDDAKLFNVGVTLNARDIEDIIARNAGNPTMQSLAARYAAEHNITGSFTFDSPAEQAASHARDLDSVIDKYTNTWMQSDIAESMLDQFFGMG